MQNISAQHKKLNKCSTCSSADKSFFDSSTSDIFAKYNKPAQGQIRKISGGPELICGVNECACVRNEELLL